MAENEVATVKPEKSQAVVAMTNGVLMPTDMDGLWRLSAVMTKSGLMPKGMDTTETVFVAIQMGFEVGLSPMQAVQNIAVINGRPAIWGDAVIGLVEASGLLEDFEETSEGTWPEDTFKAICVAKRQNRRKPIRQEYSIDDAKTAGLWKKAGPWTTAPRRMLQMRARAFVLRDGFADVLKGLKTVEEIKDLDIEMYPDETGKFTTAVKEVEGPNTSDRFWLAMADHGITAKDALIPTYLEGMAATMNLTVEAVMARAVEEGDKNPAAWKKFVDGFKKWSKAQTKKLPVEGPKEVCIPPAGCKFESAGEAKKVDCEKLECFLMGCPAWFAEPGSDG